MIMNVKEFIESFKEEVRKLYKERCVFINDQTPLTAHGHTYLINVAIYNAVKNYNNYKKQNSQKISIFVEKGGRLPSDFELRNDNGDVELVIEHENERGNIGHNCKKLINNKSQKLLICYFNDKEDESKQDRKSVV